MALWSNTDANTSAPKYVTNYLNVPQSSANVNLAYGNTTTGAFVTGAAVGVFGVDPTEQGLASNQSEHSAHAGWVLRTAGMGGVATISAGATNKSNVGNAYVVFTGGGTGNTAANAQIFVNATTNVVTSIVLNSVGLYENTPTATVAGNANVTITLTMGGRANRNTMETLVAMGSMTGDGSASANDDTIFADS
jgi:multidrug transporter EmrE-like cation transporter